MRNRRLPTRMLLLLVAASVATTISANQPRPNIVMVFVDDMGFGDLSCFGNADIKTSRLDQLAEEGIRFTQFYTNSPICSPSRVAVTTGQYPGRHRIHSFLASRATNRQRLSRDWLDPQAPCIARAFQNAGYATAHFGKWHMGGGRDVGNAPLPQAYGWDESLVAFEGLGDRLLKRGKDQASARLKRGNIRWVEKHEKTEIFVDRSIQFARQSREAGQPFYIHLWLNDVHTAYRPSPEQLARVASLNVHPFHKQMYAVLLAMDEQIGRLVDAIDAMGLRDQTLFVVTSDNGPNLPKPHPDHPEAASRTGSFRGEKWSLYEGGIRMPWIARWPGRIPPGIVDNTTIMASIDLFPTFASLAAVDIPAAPLDGEDRSQALLGNPLPGRNRPLVWEYGRQDIKFLRPRFPENRSPNLAIRDSRWKLLVNEDGSNVQLYDLANSTDERNNVAVEHPEVARRLRDHVLAWYAELPGVGSHHGDD